MVSFQVGQAQSARGWVSAKNRTSRPNSNLKERTLTLLAAILASLQVCG
jgi:hypothetical protein